MKNNREPPIFYKDSSSDSEEEKAQVMQTNKHVIIGKEKSVFKRGVVEKEK